MNFSYEDEMGPNEGRVLGQTNIGLDNAPVTIFRGAVTPSNGRLAARNGEMKYAMTINLAQLSSPLERAILVIAHEWYHVRTRQGDDGLWESQANFEGLMAVNRYRESRGRQPALLEPVSP